MHLNYKYKNNNINEITKQFKWLEQKKTKIKKLDNNNKSQYKHKKKIEKARKIDKNTNITQKILVSRVLTVV